MAVTARGATLTRQARREQLSIRALALKEVISLWEMLDPTNIDATAVAWLRLMLGTVRRHHLAAGQQAGGYYVALKAIETSTAPPSLPTSLARGQGPSFAELPSVPGTLNPEVSIPNLIEPVNAPTVSLPNLGPDIPVVRSAELNDQQVLNSLLVTGPVAIKRRIGEGMKPEAAKQAALVETSGAVGRHVLNGGRDTVVENVAADPVAVGFARVTSPNCCAFCALMASRGFVYKSRETALFVKGTERRYHDHCACSEEPAFQRDAELPEVSAKFEQLYRESTAGKSGKAARAAFAQALEAERNES